MRFDEQIRQLEKREESATQRANESELRVQALESELQSANAQIQRPTRMRVCPLKSAFHSDYIYGIPERTFAYLRSSTSIPK